MAPSLSVLAAVALLGAPLSDPAFEETVRVERALVEVRVLDRDGKPVRGLGARDFRLEVEGERTPVLSVDWFEGYGAVDDAPLTAPQEEGSFDSPASRYTVLLVQRDLDPSRIVQLMRLGPYVLEMIDDLAPSDRMAILVHEGGLQLLADFTDDRAALRRVAEEAIIRRVPRPEVPSSGEVSLRERIGGGGLEGAVHVETALLRLGEALRGLPGSKTIFFFAWGMGVFTGAGVLERPDQGFAVDSLRAANATLFTIDLTNADFHSLEAPLIRATRETGGLYVRGHVRPEIALRRLRDAAAGTYVLAYEPPAGVGREPKVRVRVPGCEVLEGTGTFF
jgi:VWFA-related protein